MRRIGRLTTIGVAAVLALGIAAGGAAGGSPLTGKIWVLTSLQGKAPLAGTSITIAFTSDGKVSGSSGCNSYSGTYTATRGRLKISRVASTQMACAPAIMAQEGEYHQVLSSARAYGVRSGRLTLRSSLGRTLAVFAVQAQSLAGTAWNVTGFNNGKNAVVSVLAGTKLTAAFGKDGMLTGFAGCNHYDGAYTASAPKLHFGPISSTRKNCGSPAGVMGQESAYLAALGTVASYRIEGSTLELLTAKDTTAVALKRA